MSCCDLSYCCFTRTHQRIYPHGWCRTFQTSLTDPEDGRGTARGGCTARTTISSAYSEALTCLCWWCFNMKEKHLLPRLHVVFLLMWRCLPIGQLLGCNGGHMRRSARVSDTGGLLFSSVFAFRPWHWQSERFSRCITGSPKIPVFLPWSLSYSWFSQLRQLPSFLIALSFIPEEERSMDHYFGIKLILDWAVKLWFRGSKTHQFCSSSLPYMTFPDINYPSSPRPDTN